MEEIYSFETPVDFQRTIHCYIPVDTTVQKQRCDNLKSYMNILLFVMTYTCIVYTYTHIDLFAIGIFLAANEFLL
jgi:hypothetical protein